MQRIHAADTVPLLPEAPKGGTPGYFSDGNASTGDMATVIDAAWCNGVQEELMAFLAAAGIEPSAEDLGQVLAAVRKLTEEAIASGNAGTATKLANARTIGLSGDVTGSTTFDGSEDKTIAATLSESGVTAGSYGPATAETLAFGGSVNVPQVTVDAKGRVTAAANRAIKLPSAPSAVTKATQDAKGNVIDETYATKEELESLEGQMEVQAVPPSTTTPKAAGTAAVGSETKYARGDHVHPAQASVTGNAGTATKLANAQIIGLSGDVTGSTTFDGSEDKTIAATLSESGVTAGSYGPAAAETLAFGGSVNVPQVTVDSKGRVTAAASRTVKIPAAPTSVSGNAGTATKLATARKINVNLASTSAASFDGTADVTSGVTGILPVERGGTGNASGKSADSTKWNGAAKTVSTAAPSGGANNDIWIQYIA